MKSLKVCEIYDEKRVFGSKRNHFLLMFVYFILQVFCARKDTRIQVAPGVLVHCDIDRDYQKLAIQSTPKVNNKFEFRNLSGEVHFFEKIKIGRTQYSVSRISEYAFINTSITSVKFSKTIYFVGTGAFSYCSQLEHVDMSISPIYHLPSGVFNNSWNLKTLLLPPTVTTIAGYVFASTNIDSFIIKPKIRSIDGSAFSNCTNLTKISVESSKFFDVYKQCIYSKMMQKLIYCPSRIEVPEFYNEVLSISPYAFAHSQVVLVQIPSTVTIIEKYAFFDCKKLKAVKFFHSALKELEEGVFCGCSIRFLTLPKMLAKVATNCFSMPKLKDIDISQTNITALPKYLFQGSNKLHEVAIPPSVLKMEHETFHDSGIKRIIYCNVPGINLKFPPTLEVKCDKKLPISDEI